MWAMNKKVHSENQKISWDRTTALTSKACSGSYADKDSCMQTDSIALQAPSEQRGPGLK